MPTRKKISKQYKLPFTLVADKDGKVAEAFGVPMMMGGSSPRLAPIVHREGRQNRLELASRPNQGQRRRNSESPRWAEVGSHMAVDQDALRLLLLARQQGVDFRSTITLGRQSLSIGEDVLQRVLAKYRVDADSRKSMVTGFAENLFRVLGADVVDSITIPISSKRSIRDTLTNRFPRR